jgi:hypothetical protein
MKTPNKDVIRKKFLALLRRSVLEELSGLDQPWNADRAYLTECAVRRWDQDEVREHIFKLLDKVK